MKTGCEVCEVEEMRKRIKHRRRPEKDFTSNLMFNWNCFGSKNRYIN